MLTLNIVMLVLMSITKEKMRTIKGIDPCKEHKHLKMDCQEDMGNRTPVDKQIVYLEDISNSGEWCYPSNFRLPDGSYLTKYSGYPHPDITEAKERWLVWQWLNVVTIGSALNQ